MDAAIELFATKGFEATTMQDVAAAVGVTAPALYYYFDSKQKLLFEVIHENLERFNARIEAALAAPDTAGSPTRELAAFVRAHLEFQLEGVERARVYNAMFLGPGSLLGAMTPHQRSLVLAKQAVSLDRLKAILERGIAAGEFALPDVRVTTMGIIAMGEFAAGWFKPGGRLSAQEVAQHYATLALKMARPSVASVTRPSRKRT